MDCRYRKKPVVILAVKWEGNNFSEVAAFLENSDEPCDFRQPMGDDYLEINTLEGVMRANNGDWIIRGVKGEMYPCKPDIFEATYEKVL